MADAEPEQPPPPKEKKKKKSSSVKSNKSATEEAPQLNGESTPASVESKAGDVAAEAATAPQDAQPQEQLPAGGEEAAAAAASADEEIAAPAKDAPPPTEISQLQENGGVQDGEADAAVEEAEIAPAAPNAEKPEKKKSSKKEKKEKAAPPQPSAQQKAEEEAALLMENKMRELAEGFFLLDWNKDGQIDKTDLQMTFASLGFPNISDEEIGGMLGEASSPLDLDAFMDLMGTKTADLDTEDLLIKALSCWDEDSSGFISEERIRRDLMTWGDTFTEQEVTYALEDAPLYEEPEGIMINYIEFCKILCGSAPKKQD